MAYKVFSNGNALNASELNTYLMNQSVISFASTTARDAALTAPIEGQLVWLEDSNKYVYYTGSAWSDLITPASSGNAIINGAFDIWQRGTAPTWTANNTTNYQADRWLGFSVATGRTVTRQATGDTTNLPNIQYAARVQRTAANTATDGLQLWQILDTPTSVPFAGKTVTYSFYARAGANFSSGSNLLSSYLYSGTGTDQNPVYPGFTGQATAATVGATLTTTWQRFSISGTVASTATQLALQFAYNPVGTAGAADYFEVTGVQLEVGSTVTPFKRNANSIQGELAACQRYYQRISGTSSTVSSLVGTAYSSTAGVFPFPLKSSMRVTPTSVEYTNLRLSDGSGGADVTSLTIWGLSSADNAYVVGNVSSGLTTYRPYYISNSVSALSYIGLSAEL